MSALRRFGLAGVVALLSRLGGRRRRWRPQGQAAPEPAGPGAELRRGHDPGASTFEQPSAIDWLPTGRCWSPRRREALEGRDRWRQASCCSTSPPRSRPSASAGSTASPSPRLLLQPPRLPALRLQRQPGRRAAGDAADLITLTARTGRRPRRRPRPSSSARTRPGRLSADQQEARLPAVDRRHPPGRDGHPRRRRDALGRARRLQPPVQPRRSRLPHLRPRQHLREDPPHRLRGQRAARPPLLQGGQEPDADVHQGPRDRLPEPVPVLAHPEGNPLVGDVGWNMTEEIDLVRAGLNYGWPCYEGDLKTPFYRELGRCRRSTATARASRPRRARSSTTRTRPASAPPAPR